MKRRHEPRHSKIVHKNYSTQSALLTYSTWFKAWSNKYTHITQDYDNNDINSTSHHLQHTFAFFLRLHDIQHIAHHKWNHRLYRFWLAIPDRNRVYQKLLPLIRTALPRKMRQRILKGQRPNRHELVPQMFYKLAYFPKRQKCNKLCNMCQEIVSFVGGRGPSASFICLYAISKALIVLVWQRQHATLFYLYQAAQPC